MKNSSVRIGGLLIAIVVLQMPGWLFAPPPTVGEATILKFLNAIKNENYREVERVLNEGVDPNVRWRGLTPLHIALLAHSPRMVRFLLDKGANPHKKVIGEMDLFDETAGMNSLEIARNTLRRKEETLRTMVPGLARDNAQIQITNLREIVQMLQNY